MSKWYTILSVFMAPIRIIGAVSSRRATRGEFGWQAGMHDDVGQPDTEMLKVSKFIRTDLVVHVRRPKNYAKY